MHEIEIKAALKNKEAFIKALSERGCEFGQEIKQDDTIYAREIETLEIFLSNSDFLRIRVQNDGKTLFAFKHHPGRIRSLDSAPLELELEVSSREVMEHILSIMGYKEAARVTKVRRKTKYQNWEICIDDVEGLGAYVEVEELADSNDDIVSIQERMRVFLAEFGIGEEDLINNRYDVMLMQKRGGM
ncbi:MAG: putative Adenylyl cyclase CyaB [Parcubacteria group bacterium]|nr:putative Adenylyl cyclase CyaB [Parcubacteria group bacterium]